MNKALGVTHNEKILSVVLTITMLCSMTTAAFADGEVKSDTLAKNAKNFEYILPIEYKTINRLQNGYIAYDKQEKCVIYDLNEKNIIKADTNYNYTAFITREEFCELVFNYIENFSESAFSIGVINPPFTDTDNEHIGTLNALGIINGKSETEFEPNDSLTREEAAAILCRLIKEMYPNAAATEMYFVFADGDQISDWAMNNIQVICNMGIMKGVGDNKFAPKELYTTEQAITTLVRVHKLFKG